MEVDQNVRLSSGIPGLDEVLNGGFISGRAYLVRGGPGTGKTTMGLHYLLDGVAKNEPVLFITLVESEARHRENAKLKGTDITGIEFLDLCPDSEFFSQMQSYDIFASAEVEQGPTTQKIVETVERVKPKRVFLDSMTQFRYLTTDNVQFRKQTASFLSFLVEKGATVLFTSESMDATADDDLQFMSDGVLHLDYNTMERLVSVTKFRGSSFRDGHHSAQLTAHGMEVFPRILPVTRSKQFVSESITSGIPDLDELLHGGLERGTVTIISGPSGVGKTTLGLQFMKEAAGRGERSVVYSFEESEGTIFHRAESIGIPLRTMAQRGTFSLVAVEPLTITPDEFSHQVRLEVEKKGTRIIMIDSVAGYRLVLRNSAEITIQLHALLRYLNSMDITTILINEVESIVGDFRATEMGISYLADNIVFLRYLEMQGELRRAIGVLKKRLSDFEKTLREYKITRYGIRVGAPLTHLRGILRGVPEWTDGPKKSES